METRQVIVYCYFGILTSKISMNRPIELMFLDVLQKLQAQLWFLSIEAELHNKIHTAISIHLSSDRLLLEQYTSNYCI